MKFAIVGATGIVGSELISLIDSGYFPECSEIIPIASSDSVGKTIDCKNEKWTCRSLELESFRDIDIASFSVGDELSAEWIPKLLNAYPDIRIVDKSNSFRMSNNVPLVVYGVNQNYIFDGCRLVANPNCTTIQLAIALKPIFDSFGLSRLIVSTYQSVSGGGRDALDYLNNEIDSFEKPHIPTELNSKGIAHNVLPLIGSLDEHGFAGEESKITNETQKIFNNIALKVIATSCRVDVFVGHSISVYLELKQAAEYLGIEECLRNGYAIDYFPNIPELFPTPLSASRPDYDFVQVGRLREIGDTGKEYFLFCCANNLRIGAALNALRIGRQMLGLSN